jgi:hypothetical protein
MELDAPYCDVIVQRWENFTGRKAERQAKAAGLLPQLEDHRRKPALPARKGKGK